MLATPATFRGKLIKDVIQHFAEPAGVQVLTVTCLDLVPYVEAGLQYSPACRASLKMVLDPVVAQGTDYLVLGCTHYPYLKNTIQAIYPQNLTLVDSGMAVARQTARILIKNKLVSESRPKPRIKLKCFASGDNAHELEGILAHLIHSDISWSIENIVDKLNLAF